MAQYMLRRYQERRAMVIEMLGGRCRRCGSVDQLEIDHIDPSSKTYDVARILGSASKNRLMSEVVKCQLLCSACHQHKSIIEVGKNSAKGTHGTLSGYRYCGPPRCSECLKVKTAANQKAYQKRKAYKQEKAA
jgi:hypothetical protein